MKNTPVKPLFPSLPRCGPECTQTTSGPGKAAPANQRRSEKGIVLVLALILCAVTLAIVTALIYMITSGTQSSGLQKRYRTAFEAGLAASDVMTQVLGIHGDEADVASFVSNSLSVINAQENTAVLSTCSGTAYMFTSSTPTTISGLAAKILTSSTTWSPSTGCITSLATGSSSYDLKFQLPGTKPEWNVYAKIVDTVEGNTNGSNTGGHQLVTTGVVSAKGGSGEISSVTLPYQYTVEVEAESTNPGIKERARLSVLYQQ
ncbi:MAG: pilus assembly PilX N-terminal domain-containing protein [Nitrospiraceae bacterium]|nr:pilus assembly PilX N-terminal domain-containing protein [Nitrospiraceae bacterium]